MAKSRCPLFFYIKNMSCDKGTKNVGPNPLIYDMLYIVNPAILNDPGNLLIETASYLAKMFGSKERTYMINLAWKLKFFGFLPYFAFLFLTLSNGWKGMERQIDSYPVQGKQEEICILQKMKTESIKEFLEPDVQEVLFGDQKIVKFVLGLGWEDGYHMHATQDEALISEILTEVRNLRIYTEEDVSGYACDATVDLIFFTKDGIHGAISFNDDRLEIYDENWNSKLYQTEDMSALWKLCLVVYEEGDQISYWE